MIYRLRCMKTFFSTVIVRIIWRILFSCAFDCFLGDGSGREGENLFLKESTGNIYFYFWKRSPKSIYHNFKLECRYQKLPWKIFIFNLIFKSKTRTISIQSKWLNTVGRYMSFRNIIVVLHEKLFGEMIIFHFDSTLIAKTTYFLV